MAILTDDEKREVMRCLEDNQPLPDRYRFLLFDDDRQLELVWHGKKRILNNFSRPLQKIEEVGVINEELHERQQYVSLNSGKRTDADGWANKLIWGDNKIVLNSLKEGNLGREIEGQGGIKLIYMDPPFDVGTNFSRTTQMGPVPFTQKAKTLQQVAYRDVWGTGSDSYISMIYERLVLAREVLSEDGSIYLHCDWRVSGILRMLMDEVFGKQNFINEIIWGYKTGGIPGTVGFAKKHDTILFYSKSANRIFNVQEQKSYVPTLPEPHTVSGKRLRVKRDEVCAFCGVGSPGQKYRMIRARDVWDDIPSIYRNDSQLTGYETQKPEALLERIIRASSNQGQIVADFFCGSGTTPAVAEKLGRKWIAVDIGKLAIHTVRKRMIEVRDQLKTENRLHRGFELLALRNPLGKPCGSPVLDESHYTANVEAEIYQAGGQITVELTNYIVHSTELPQGGVKTDSTSQQGVIAVDNGQLVKLHRDKKGNVDREPLTQHWSDWIDYWSIDFNYQGQVAGLNNDGKWDPGDVDENTPVFQSHWQSFRTLRRRDLQLRGILCDGSTKPRKIAVKIVDVLGNETLKVFPLNA